ncbi:hypothetical protein IV498_17970 [Paenarthrobacter sp. Z7-10]|nr:hypothetical protein [Paenarthrobacter sp. Z7-10]MCZ2404995.1 hypothetical protein [Paenarthrobacter sp. Z7-10]
MFLAAPVAPGITPSGGGMILLWTGPGAAILGGINGYDADEAVVVAACE